MESWFKSVSNFRKIIAVYLAWVFLNLVWIFTAPRYSNDIDTDLIPWTSFRLYDYDLGDFIFNSLSPILLLLVVYFWMSSNSLRKN